MEYIVLQSLATERYNIENLENNVRLDKFWMQYIFKCLREYG